MAKAPLVVFHKQTSISIEKIQLAPYNPRTIDKKKYAALKQSLLAYGFVDPVVVQRLSKAHGKNVLVGGHQRIRALKEIYEAVAVRTLPDIPAIVLDLVDARAMKLNIILNRLHGEFDKKKLAEVFATLQDDFKMPAEDFPELGFAESEVLKISELLNDEPVDLPKEHDGAVRVRYTCPKCSYEWS